MTGAASATALLVAGPHRSGTSALMGVLQRLGVDLGGDLLPADRSNPRGYFESRRIVAAHEALLEALGMGWEDPGPLPAGWLRGRPARRCREEILAVLREELGDSRLWGVKDPRICRLLPLWRQILRAMECRPLVVMVLRHPDEVARSLTRRDELPAGRGRLLWLEHLLRAEADSRGLPRVLVAYDDLLSDWRQVVERIAAAGSFQWPEAAARRRDEIEEFLSPSLRHQRAGDLDLAEGKRSSWVAEVYRALRGGRDLEDPQLKTELTGIRRAVDRALGLVAGDALAVSAPLRAELARHRATRGELEEELARQRATRGELEEELARHRATRGELEEELARQRATRGELEEELARQRVTRAELEEDLQRHRATRGELEAGLAASRHRAAELGEELESNKAQRAQLEKDRLALDGEVESLRGLKDELAQEAGTLRRRQEGLEAELARELRDKAALEAEIGVARDRESALSAELSRSRSTVAELEEAVRELREERTSLHEERTSLRDELDRQLASVARHTERLAVLGATGQRLSRSAVQRRADFEGLREALRGVLDRGRDLDRDVSGLHSRVATLGSTVRRVHSAMRRLNREAVRERTRRLRQKGELLALETRFERAQSPRVEARREAAAAQAELAATRQRLDRLRLALAVAERRLKEQGQLLSAVLSSRSWRLTQPLRRLGAGLLQRWRSGEPLAAGAFGPPVPVVGSGVIANVDTFQVVGSLESGGRQLVISGWCFAPGRAEPVRLELRSPGEPIAVIECTDERPDVVSAHAQDGSPPLRCGFLLQTDLPEEFDQLELVSREYGVVLARRLRRELLPSGQVDRYEAFRVNNALGPPVREVLVRAIPRLAWKPTFGVAMDLRLSDPGGLTETLESLQAQVYEDWVLRLAAGPGQEPELEAVLEDRGADPRVGIVKVEEGCQRAPALNAAAAGCDTDFVSFLEAGDRLEPQAWFEIARRLQSDRGAALVYPDHEVVDESSGQRHPWFKPDWSPILLLGCDYIGPFFALRRDLFVELGGWSEDADEAAGHDLLLRVAERVDRGLHVPRVLCSARRSPSVAARAWGAPPVAAARHAVERALERRSSAAVIRRRKPTPGGGEVPAAGLEWPDAGPQVTIIIPTYNQHELLSVCVESILGRTSYLDFDLLVVDNGSDCAETLSYLESIRGPGVRVLEVPRDPAGFSFSAVNNRAVETADAELVLFLNNDTEIVEDHWLSRLVGYCRLPGVGAAGARLVYPDGSIQHAGVVLQMNDGLAPGHAFYGWRDDRPSYGGLAETPREVAAVTAACLLTPRRLFLELGGFDEERFPVVLNDVDYCLRLADRGLRSIYVADARVVHHESRSREKLDDPSQLVRFKARYRRRADPYYNPNLIREPRRSFAIDTACSLDYFRLLERPLRLLCVKPAAGAGRSAELPWSALAALAEQGRVEPALAHMGEPPAAVSGSGLECRRLEPPEDAEPGAALRNAVADRLAESRPDVLLAVGLDGLPAIEAAEAAAIPCLWMIPELRSVAEIEGLGAATASACAEEAFAACYRVLLPSAETRGLYERFDSRRNLQVMYHALPLPEYDHQASRISRQAVRRELGVADGEVVVVDVGELAPGRGQETVLEALARVAPAGAKVRAFLVGAAESPEYLRSLRRRSRALGLKTRVSLVTEPEADVHRYFRAADIFACAPEAGGYPVEVLEAMAHRLPVVATSFCGIAEQVQVGGSAWLVPVRDAQAMAARLSALAGSEASRRAMGESGRSVLEYQTSFRELVERLEQLVGAAWMVGAAAEAARRHGEGPRRASDSAAAAPRRALR